jgi:hypothetical protein
MNLSLLFVLGWPDTLAGRLFHRGRNTWAFIVGGVFDRLAAGQLYNRPAVGPDGDFGYGRLAHGARIECLTRGQNVFTTL